MQMKMSMMTCGTLTGGTCSKLQGEHSSLVQSVQIQCPLKGPLRMNLSWLI